MKTSNRRSPSLLASLASAALLAVVACGDDGTGPDLPELEILTESLPAAEVGEPYAVGIEAEGGDGGYAWEVVAGTLPSGLTLSVEDLADDDAVITGIPVEAGTSTFRVRVTDDGGRTDTASFAIQVQPSTALAIRNVALPPTVVGGQVEIPLRLVSSPPDSASWAVVAGSLPPGLVLGTDDGMITGTATTVGEYGFTVRAWRGARSTSASFTMRVVPDDTDSFQLTTFAVVTVPEAIRPHVEAAVARWEAVLDGDLEGGTIPADFFGPNGCGGFGQEANGTAVDDLLVLVNIDSIDGPGQVLAQAGPCGIRDDDMPFVGIITLDSQDLLPIVGTSTLTSIIAHEMGHVLGIGTLWRLNDLLEGAGTDDPRFTGERAVAEWQALGGTGLVPVENQGGQGTADGHFRESVFDDELMTGFSEPVGVPQPLSRVTVAALADAGYSVILSAADEYELDSASLAPGARLRPDLGWDVVGGVGPLRRLDLSPRRGGSRR